jgi:nucleoporin NUP2
VADPSQNMAMSATFDPSADGSQIKFLGFDLEGKPGPYSLRVKTADVAKDIVQKMKDEVEAIKKE